MIKKNRRPVLILTLAMLGSVTGWTFEGLEGASFLDIPIGGRPAALGSAYAPIAEDAYASFYNPGGLGFLDSSQFAAQHLSYLESINYEFAAFAHPFTKGSALGISIQYLHPEDTPTTDLAGNVSEEFSGSYQAYSLAYGHAFGPKFALGIGGKFVRAKIASESADTGAGDIGMLIRPTSALAFSVGATNIGGRLTFMQEEDSLPLSYRIGAAFRSAKDWLVSIQETIAKSGSESTQGGVEWNPVEYIAIRAGYRTDTRRELDSISGLTTGIGFKLGDHELDYSWVPLGDLGQMQYFSILFRIGSKRYDAGPKEKAPLPADRQDEMSTKEKPLRNEGKLYMPPEEAFPRYRRRGLHP